MDDQQMKYDPADDEEMTYDAEQVKRLAENLRIQRMTNIQKEDKP